MQDHDLIEAWSFSVLEKRCGHYFSRKRAGGNLLNKGPRISDAGLRKLLIFELH